MSVRHPAPAARRRGGRGAVLGAVLVMLLAGCASSGSSADDDAGGAGSCARRLEFADRVYTDVANVEITVGDELGTGSLLPCDDTGGQGGGDDTTERLNVYAVDGLDVADAVAAGSAAADAQLFALEGDDLPAAVQDYVDAQ